MLNEKNKLFFQPIIPRQTAYPCRSGVLGYTIRRKQKQVEMSVFRGENSDPKQNTHLGELMLPVSPPQSEQVPIGAIFELDANGIIHFTAVQLPIGERSASIMQYAIEQDGALDLPAVDALIDSGEAKTKMVKIESGL